MKYRVIKYFIDKDSLKGYSAGDEYPCEDPSRAAQLINRCYIERVPEPENEQEPVEEEKPKKTLTAKAKSTTKKPVKKKA